MSIAATTLTISRLKYASIFIILMIFSLVISSCQYPGNPEPKYDENGNQILPDNPGEPGDPGGSGVNAYLEDEQGVGVISGQDPNSSSGSGDLKPVGFVNYGEFDAVVMAWTYVPLGETQPRTPSSASTVSSANTGAGTWPNTSRYLSVPMGAYTWCIDWEEGDLDEDGNIDYFHYIEAEPTILDENDSDELEFAEEVLISAPPASGAINKGRCDQSLVESSCAGNNIEVNVYSTHAADQDDAPEIIAKTNFSENPAPDGIVVSVGGVSTPWGTGMILWQAGDWIQATTSDPYLAIGGQIFGDKTIGWARVLFDGNEVWQGDASTYTIAAGIYGVYVEVSCFPPGSHTLRIEAMGSNGSGGGMSIPVGYFGFRP